MSSTFSQADQSDLTEIEPDLRAHVPKGDLLVGTLVDFDSAGAPRVKFALGAEWHTIVATPAISVHAQHIGRQAVLMLPGGDVKTPLLLGFVFSALDSALEQPVPAAGARGDSDQLFLEAPQAPVSAEVDGNQTLIEGDKQIVLRCGEASITLTRSGKIILRGKHLVSRSSGVNRIMGGSIQMN